jgi:predicted phosphodiesterase
MRRKGMRIQIVSDLHAEFYKRPIESLETLTNGSIGDVLVLAGDICPVSMSEIWRESMRYLCDRYERVIYVPGNHEHYSISLETSKRALIEASKELPNLVMNWSGKEEIDGVSFLLATLWYEDSPDCYIGRHLISDFSLIKGSDPSLFIEEGKKDRVLIEEEGASCPIWIFHHLPSPQSIGMRYRGAMSNCYYLNDIERLIQKYQPKLVIHGHTHDSYDYTLGETRVICNPRGYEGEVNKDFNPSLIVDV